MNQLQSGVEFAAYPDREMAATLRRWIGCQRFIYNAKVSEDALFAAQRRLWLREHPQDKINTPLDRLYSQFKNEELTPWLSEVPSQVLREGTYRWFNAKQRQLKGLAKAPRRRNRKNFSSVLLFSELFRFVGKECLQLGSAAKPAGALRFHAHRAYAQPKTISIKEVAGRWFVSFSYEHASAEVLRSEQELAYELGLLDEAGLSAATLGIDRNVADNCIATSTGQFHLPEAVTRERMARKERGARRHQRRLAKTQKGSSNRRKVARRIAKAQAYRARVTKDFAHKTSRQIVDSGVKLIAFEDLKIQSMVRRPKAKQAENGCWQRNGARAKAGLNRSILASAWGRIAQYTQYKAERKNVLVVKVKPHHTSQECSHCGHTHPDNRNASEFVCQRCGYEQHADLNAAKNIAARGIALARSGELCKAQKTKKRVAVKRRTSGSERPVVSVECLQDAPINRKVDSTAQGAVKQKAHAARRDAPTTAPRA